MTAREPSLPKDKKLFEPEPTGLGRLHDLFKSGSTCVLQIEVRALAASCRCDHRVGNALAIVVIIFIGWKFLTNGFQRSRHVSQGILIELDQHALTIPLCFIARVRLTPNESLQ